NTKVLESYMIKIQVGYQAQAEEPIFLLSSGHICCGEYKYQGRMKNDFKGVYQTILDLVKNKPTDDVLDVTKYQYWNALNIYEELIAKEWKKSVSAKKLHQLSIETEVYLMIEPIKNEFKRAVHARWLRESKKYEFGDPKRPAKGWQIFIAPEKR
ncbi:hypothetical protein ACW9OX_004407, partial [Vibrio vulnificus]